MITGSSRFRIQSQCSLWATLLVCCCVSCFLPVISPLPAQAVHQMAGASSSGPHDVHNVGLPCYRQCTRWQTRWGLHSPFMTATC